MPLKRGIPYQPYSFLIKKLGGLIVAQDDKGVIRFSGTDASVIQSAINALSAAGGTVFLKEIEKPSNITIPAKVVLIEDYQGKRTIYTVNGRINGFPRLPQYSMIDYKTNLPPIKFIYPDEACRFEDISLWTAGPGATFVADTVNFKEGRQGIKVISTYTGYQCRIDRLNLNLDLSQRSFKAYVYVYDITKLNEIVFYFQSGGTWDNYYSIHFPSSYLMNGWNELTFVRPMFNKVGSPDWSNITGIRLTVRALTDGVAAEVTFDDYRAYLDEYTGKVILCFDDSHHQEHFTIAKRYMDKYGFRGVHACVVNQVGVGGGITLSQLKLMQEAGWDIINHTLNHLDLTQISLDEAEKEIYGAQKWLLDNGFIKGARFFAPPHHRYNSEVLQIIKKYHVLCRTSRYEGYESFALGKDNIYYLKYRSTPLTPPWDWSTIKSYIDTAVANNCLLILVMHRIDETVFSTMVDYLYNQNIEVITFSDLVDNLAIFKNRLKNSGTATITAGNTYVDVTHGLAITPDINRIKITPKDNLGGRNWWVSNVTSTTFRINISSADTVDHAFGWSYE